MGAGQNLPPAKPRPHGSHACANRPEKRDRGGFKGWAGGRRNLAVPHLDKKQGRYEIGSSKWQGSPDEVEAHERTAGAAGKVLEGR